MTSTHTLLCLATGAGIAIAGAHVRQAIEHGTHMASHESQGKSASVRIASGALEHSPSVKLQTSLPTGVARSVASATLDDLFAAIAAVETGGHPDPCNAIGDNGASVGMYQIGQAYWLDSWKMPEMTPARKARYEHDVRDPLMAKCVMLNYWNRYAPAALADLDFETLSRVHNGGPKGAEKESTLAYWAKVLAALEALP